MSRNKQDSIENVNSVEGDPKPSACTNASDNYVNCKTMQISENIGSKHQQGERESDSDSDSSEDEYSSSFSVLKIMAKNHSSISHTVSLIHKEVGKFNVEVAPNVERSIKSITEQTDDDDAGPPIEDPELTHRSGVPQKHTVGSDLNELSPATGKSNICDGKTASDGLVVAKSNDKRLLVQNKEIEAVSSLLGDANVQQLIKSVAGGETASLIDKTLDAVNSSKSIQEKRAIVTGGIKQLHSDLLANKERIGRDALFSFALDVAGINRRSINFD